MKKATAIFIVLAFVALLFVLTGAEPQGHSHDHGHSHSHSHSHSHDHGHSHAAAPKKIQPVVPKRFGIWTEALLATTLIGVAPIIILFFVPLISTDSTGKRIVNHSLLKTLLGFAVGGLLGDVFLHLLPHAISPHAADGSHTHSHSDSESEHSHTKEMMIGLLILCGIFSFFFVEKIMRIRAAAGGSSGHSHSHSHKDAPSHAHPSKGTPSPEIRQRKPKSKSSDSEGEESSSKGHAETESARHTSRVTAILNIIADSCHNFTDGMAIGASFLASPALGWSTTVAIFFHEIPHELGDYAILVQSGFSKRNAMLVQLGTAVGAILGTLTALIAGGQLESISEYILPFTAGGFIYIATVNVLPELLSETNTWQTIKEMFTIGLGVGIMALIAIYE